MIILKHDIAAATESVRNSTPEEKRELIEFHANPSRMNSFIEDLFKNFHKMTNPSLNVENVVDEAGKNYSNLRIIVTSSFTLNGVDYLSDGNFAIPFSSLMNNLLKIIENELL